MTINFPLPLAYFWDALPLRGGTEFELLPYMGQSMDGAGNILADRRGQPKWKFDGEVTPALFASAVQRESLFKALKTRHGSFLAYDKRNPYPVSDVGGAKLGNGSLVAIGGEAAYGNVTTAQYRYEGGAVTLTQAVSVAGDAGTYIDIAGVLQTSAVNTVRLDHQPGTHLPVGILVEPQFTNLCIRSEELSNAAWTATQCPVTANVGAAPDGTSTADLLIPTAVNASHSVTSTAFSATAGTQYVLAVFAKADGYNFLRISGEGGAFPAGDYQFFNLATGALGSTSALVDAAGVIDLGGGWYICWTVITASVTTTGSLALYVYSSDSAATFAGNATSGSRCWGAQVISGNKVRSYVKTVASSVTRAADVLTIKGKGTNDWTLTFDDASIQTGSDDPADFTISGTFLLRSRVKAWSAIRDTQPSAATVQIKSKGSNNRSIALKGLPPFYIITKGDKISVLYASTKYFLCEAMETIVADYLGETTEFEVAPFLPQALAVNDAVTLSKPCGKFRLIPDAYRPSSGEMNRSSGVGFSMISTP